MTDAIIVVGLVISVASIVGTGVWAVSSIRKDTALLRQSIDHLAEAVETLRLEMKQLDERTDNHEHRLTVLESQAPRPRDRSARSK